MDTLTGIERISNILQRRPVDRIGLFEHFWNDTQREWTAQGHIQQGENLADHFGFDMALHWAFTMIADLDVEPEVVEETEETILTRDGNGALLRRHKLHEATPEHVDFRVRDRATWEEIARPHLLEPDERRIDFEGYREAKAHARAHDRFFAWSGVNVFELMHPGLRSPVHAHGHGARSGLGQGHGRRLLPADRQAPGDPLRARGLAGRHLVLRGHGFQGPAVHVADACTARSSSRGTVHTIRYAKSRNLPVIMHSCGMVEKLLPGMVEAGIDCLQVIEVKAGMDLLKLYREYGERLSFMGGIDVRTLYSNDREIIDQELEGKIPVVKGNYGYVLHSDHSIPNTVDYDSYRYFIERGLELGSLRTRRHKTGWRNPLAESITPQREDFSRWYLDVIREAELAENSPVRGSMVIRPYGYEIWEHIRDGSGPPIQGHRAQERLLSAVYPDELSCRRKPSTSKALPPSWRSSPSEAARSSKSRWWSGPPQRRSSATCMPGGSSRTAICRCSSTSGPTSCAGRCARGLFCARWSSSGRKATPRTPRPQEAQEHTRRMLDVYADFAINDAAIPVIKGIKSDREKFAGAVASYSIEAMMANGWALQAGTSHYLGDNFSRAFDIKFLDENNEMRVLPHHQLGRQHAYGRRGDHDARRRPGAAPAAQAGAHPGRDRAHLAQRRPACRRAGNGQHRG